MLFTSYSLMGSVCKLVRGSLPFPVIEWRHAPEGIHRFKKQENAVLFAAGSCWEGMDFPGDMVSSLIIVKLPFAVPYPVSEAEKEEYEDLRKYIEERVVPDMQKKLRQGFGRAIRTETDTCVVSILDHRAAKGGISMEHYKVIGEMDGKVQCYYICETDTFEMVLDPSRYLLHKTMSNKSPNTVRRNAYSLAAYLEYLKIRDVTIDQVILMEYEEQSSHFVKFPHWLKDGNHREIEESKIPNNGICNAYLKDVFRFYLFMEMQGEYRSLKVLYYDSFTTLNSVGAKRRLRYRAFKGYLKEEEREVRAAEQNQIMMLLKACTNCRDQLLILPAAETGYRIGELLGVDYTKDIDFQNHTIRTYFRDDNENGARAKNAEYRRAKVSNETFEFLLYYLAEYRKYLQHQQLLFVNIAGEEAGKALDVDAVYSMFRRMEHKTGLKLKNLYPPGRGDRF